MRWKILGAVVGGAALFATMLTIRPEAASAACDPNYRGVCLPLFSGVDNVDCDSPEVTLSNFPASVADPYGLDRDHDGVACDKNGRPGFETLTKRAWALMVARDEPAAPATPTLSQTATSTSIPTATATPVPSAHTWYTSAASSAKYYYCDLDDGWKSLSPANLRSYPSEAALLAVWGSSRTKHPDSHC